MYTANIFFIIKARESNIFLTGRNIQTESDSPKVLEPGISKRKDMNTVYQP